MLRLRLAALLLVVPAACSKKEPPPPVKPDAAAVATPVVGTTGEASVVGCVSKLTPEVKLAEGDLTLSRSCGNVTIEGDVVINDRKVTVEAGVTVVFAEAASLTIAYTGQGSLVAVGKPDSPVVFTGLVKTPGSWKGLALEPNSRLSRLEHVVVEYAGAGEQGFALRVRGTDNAILASSFRAGQGTGLLVPDEPVGFSEVVSGNRFEGFAKGAMRVHPRQLSEIGANQVGTQAIELLAGNLELSATMREGVTYRLLGEVVVQRRPDMAETPVLTVEAGATVEAAAGAQLSVAASEGGSLKAVGTAERPIRFTSFDKANGSWKGIHLYPAARGVVLEHVIVEYADANDAHGAIHADEGAEAELRDVRFEHLDGYGLSLSGKAKVTRERLSVRAAKGTEVPRK